MPDKPLILGELPLQRVDAFKYLGVLSQDNMSWSPHVQATWSKAGKKKKKKKGSWTTLSKVLQMF